MDGGRKLCPQNYNFTQGADITLRTFQEDYRSSFYWLVDYERDNHGEPVRDGTYTIQLMGTETSLMGSTDGSIPESSTVKTTEMNRESFALTNGSLLQQEMVLEVSIFSQLRTSLNTFTAKMLLEAKETLWNIIICANKQNRKHINGNSKR